MHARRRPVRRRVERVHAFSFGRRAAAAGRGRPQLRRLARRHLRKVGLEHVRVMPTAGHPIVYADWLHAPGRPTVLVYGHYDVQPADPIDAWHSPPFEPSRRGDNLFGRGASDDKGQMFTHVKAMEACCAATRRLPVNVKCLFEGEEEIGSTNLAGLPAPTSRRAGG